MKQINICPRCGGELIEINGKYRCSFCNAIFEEEKVLDIKQELNSLLDELKQEKVANLRQRLWEATHEKYMSSDKITSISQEIRNYLPDDFLACFYETVNTKSTSEINDYLNNINIRANIYDMDIVIEFMIKVMEEGNLLAVNNLIEKTYKARNLTLYEKYATILSKQAEEIKEGVYDLDVTRDVFVAYSSKDMKYVDEVVSTLEDNGISCFVALRNLRHGIGAKENYEKGLEKAIDNSKIFLLISTPNSRSRDCDAFTKEMPYIKKRDIELAPAEYRFDYTKIPTKYKKPRIQYLVGDKPKGTIADSVVEEFFSGIEWCYSADSAARIAFRMLDEGIVEVESEAEKKLRELEEKQRKQQEELKKMMEEMMKNQAPSPKQNDDSEALRKELEELKKSLSENSNYSPKVQLEPGLYDVILKNYVDKVATIKTVSAITNLNLIEAKMVVDKTPVTIVSGVSNEDAVKYQKMFEDIKSTVEIKKKEQTTNTFDVILTECSSKVSAIKVVQEITGAGLLDAKRMVDQMPVVVISGVPYYEATRFQDMFEEVDATVEIKAK